MYIHESYRIFHLIFDLNTYDQFECKCFYLKQLCQLCTDTSIHFTNVVYTMVTARLSTRLTKESRRTFTTGGVICTQETVRVSDTTLITWVNFFTAVLTLSRIFIAWNIQTFWITFIITVGAIKSRLTCITHVSVEIPFTFNAVSWHLFVFVIFARSRAIVITVFSVFSLKTFLTKWSSETFYTTNRTRAIAFVTITI